MILNTPFLKLDSKSIIRTYCPLKKAPLISFEFAQKSARLGAAHCIIVVIIIYRPVLKYELYKLPIDRRIEAAKAVHMCTYGR